MATQLGNVAVGTTLYLNENSSPVPYLVVHQGIPSSMYDASCNGTWLLRKDIYANAQWNNSNYNGFVSATINTSYLPGLLSIYDSEIQSAIKAVKIPYCEGNGGSQVNSGANGYSCKVFSLSAYELGLTKSDHSSIVEDGAKLSYFDSGSGETALSKRISYKLGIPSYWWLRTTTKGFQTMAFTIGSSGGLGSNVCTTSYGVRQAIILPTNLIVDNSENITANIVPTAPASITVPASSVPAGSSVFVTWPEGANATGYTLQRSVNGGSWQTVYTGANLSFTDTAQGNWTQVQYQVASTASGFTSAYTVSSVVTILPYTITTLTVPSIIMQGQGFSVSWSAVTSATTYVLQRNVNSGGWEQVYSGSSTSFSDTPQSTWTTVQYQVQAGDGTTFGAFKTSDVVPVISASALVISGSDSDLGILTADVPYTVSSDTGNPITLTRTVNGNLIATLTVSSNFAYTIPVMDLPTGSGTIEISASVNTSGGIISATRTWTYQKTAITFPASGGVAQLSMNSNNVFPPTLAEAVRVPTNWGGTLDKALELLYEAANSAVISVGTYEGSGTFGVDNPNTLTISPSPQVVTIYGAGQTLVISSTDTSSPAYIDGTTVKWYSTVSAADQMNTDGVTYSYVAVAKGVTA